MRPVETHARQVVPLRRYRDRNLVLAGRVVGAGLLIAAGAIHLYLYRLGYRAVPTIGPLFLLNTVVAEVAAVVTLAVPRRWLGWVSLGGAAFQAGTLGALLLSLTVGLFGFTETVQAPLIVPTIIVEATGALVLLCLAWYELVARRRSRYR